MENALEPRRPAWSRPEVVFMTAALVLLGAFLVPISPTILAVLWVCTFCLAGAVTIICLAAGSSADLIGFVPLISSATLLRLVALAAASRRIAQQDNPDPLTNATGLFLAQNWPLGAILICLLIAVVVSIAVFAASQRIFLASTGYIRQILPLKRIGIETDMRMGVITEEQAQTLAQRIVTEFRFFAGMHGVATLVRGEIAIIVVVLLGCLLMPALAPDSQNLSGQELMTQHVPPAVGLAVFTLIPAVIAATACGAMMSADTLALRSETPSDTAPAPRKIAITANESGATEDIELLNPDFVLHDNERITDFEPLEPDTADSYAPQAGSKNAFEEALQNAHTGGQPSAKAPESAPGEDLEPVQPPADQPSLSAGTVQPSEAMTCRNAEEYYEKLSRKILHSAMPARVLLAADSAVDLPVTVAVNVAIRLAQKQRKVLIVDSDVSRSALAQVFDLDPRMLQKKVLPSCFENLSVCIVQASKLTRLLQKTTVTRAFDVLLVYAPDSSELKVKSPQHMTAFFFSSHSTAASLPADIADATELIPPIHSVLDAK